MVNRKLPDYVVIIMFFVVVISIIVLSVKYVGSSVNDHFRERDKQLYQAEITACVKARGEVGRASCEYDALLRWGGRIP